jgi:hypothetical protein
VAVEHLFSQDSWLFSQAPGSTEVAAVQRAVTGSFTILAEVDYVFGSSYMGIFVAAAPAFGQRAFSAVAVDSTGVVQGFTGTMTDTFGVLAVTSLTPIAVTNGSLGTFPNYLSYVAPAQQWSYTHSGATQELYSNVALNLTPSIGGVMMFTASPGGDPPNAKVATVRVIDSVMTGYPAHPVALEYDNSMVTDDGAMNTITTSAEPRTHAIVGAQFGDLEYDVGKSVPWTALFTDDVFIADINNGDPRYWVIDWDKSFAGSKFLSLGVDFFTDPAAWREAQFLAADAAWNYDNDDWVLFVDAHEGMSCDTRSLPDDVVVNPFASYVHREITRAVGLGADRVVIPFFAFVRNAVPSPTSWQITDPLLVQDRLANSGSTFTVEDVNTATVQIGVPYYYQRNPFTERGLIRLVKVSALRNPSFDWLSIDTLTTPSDDVKMQIISYAYARWLDDDGVEQGMKMRDKISQVRSLTGLPTVGTDATGTAGPYSTSTGGVLTDVAGATSQTQPLLTPMYSGVFRDNPRDGVWYSVGALGPRPYAVFADAAAATAVADNAQAASNAGTATKPIAGTAAASSAAANPGINGSPTQNTGSAGGAANDATVFV